AGICQRYPGFCEYSPGLKHAYDDPCQHATYGNLICKLLPAAQASLIRTIDLARSMEGLQFEIQENMLLFYSSKGLKNLRQAIQQSQERLALAQHQFGQLHTAYCRLDTPLKQLSNLPFSHYIHATIFAHLDLSKVWLDQWQTHLIAIHASTEGKDGRPPQKHLKAMEECRLLALRHLEEAQFWMNRQYAWVLPMER
ncbi:MAG: hypothetical protein KDD06_20080, partial [Phaeodactylibacter sp.]|nr:hypothetical protein [Phaeodactylibacter sp.]